MSAANKRLSFFKQEDRSSEVDVVRLDYFAEQHQLKPEFIKIDVEGFEAEVLRGMVALLKNRKPMLMVEIQRHHNEILNRLTGAGYIGFNDRLTRIVSSGQLVLNTFFLHTEAHAKEIQALAL